VWLELGLRVLLGMGGAEDFRDIDGSKTGIFTEN